ncbi:MAG: hypothetical protein ABIA63_13390 [bacterium]
MAWRAEAGRRRGTGAGSRIIVLPLLPHLVVVFKDKRGKKNVDCNAMVSSKEYRVLIAVTAPVFAAGITIL